jgi:MOSC domain-containing protein YiiM
VGQPQTYVDETGTWSSSIFREPVTGPIELGPRGLAGDRVTDTKNHGKPDQAVCCHPLDHYAYWNGLYALMTDERALGPGSVGENWTLAGADEADICIGDVYGVGSTRIQVAGPRYPCSKQDRKLQMPGFAEAAGKALRTGFYLRVLTPGKVQAGDGWALEIRSQPDLSIYAINRAWFHQTDDDIALRVIAAPEAPEWWQGQFRKRLGK